MILRQSQLVQSLTTHTAKSSALIPLTIAWPQHDLAAAPDDAADYVVCPKNFDTTYSQDDDND